MLLTVKLLVSQPTVFNDSSTHSSAAAYSSKPKGTQQAPQFQLSLSYRFLKVQNHGFLVSYVMGDRPHDRTRLTCNPMYQLPAYTVWM